MLLSDRSSNPRKEANGGIRNGYLVVLAPTASIWNLIVNVHLERRSTIQQGRNGLIVAPFLRPLSRQGTH